MPGFLKSSLRNRFGSHEVCFISSVAGFFDNMLPKRANTVTGADFAGRASNWPGTVGLRVGMPFVRFAASVCALSGAMR